MLVAIIATAVAAPLMPSSAPTADMQATPPIMQELPAGSPAAPSQPTAPEILSSADLEVARGGQSVVINNQSLSSVTSNNILNGDYVAGAISLGDNALANFNGLGNFAINTGAQVSLQSGMSVTINVGR